MLTYLKLGLGIALLAAIAWGAYADYGAGKKAGQDAVQTAWNADRLKIQQVTDAAIAQATKERDTALQNNAQVIDDTTKQIDALRTLNADLSGSLRDYEARAAAYRSSLSQANDQLDPVTGSAAPSLGSLNAAVADTLNECGEVRIKYKSLIAEIKPQVDESSTR